MCVGLLSFFAFHRGFQKIRIASLYLSLEIMPFSFCTNELEYCKEVQSFSVPQNLQEVQHKKMIYSSNPTLYLFQIS